MDFEDRLADYIDTLDTGLPLYFDVTDNEESLSIAALPGGNTKRVYMNGDKDKLLNYEIQAKVKMNNRDKATKALFLIADKLSELEELPSHDNSYEFENIKVSNEMYSSQIADDFRYFIITIQPLLMIKKKGD